MIEDDFWNLVEAARAEVSAASVGDAADRVVEAAAVTLSARSVDEMLAFDRIVSELMDRSYRNELWAAGYLINGGCSDDGFDYFRVPRVVHRWRRQSTVRWDGLSGRSPRGSPRGCTTLTVPGACANGLGVAGHMYNTPDLPGGLLGQLGTCP
jgi:Protein of unknown function (DUF4240)